MANLTRQGFIKFEKELEGLIAKRKEVLANLVKARDMGDLSENGAYKGARFELGNIDHRIKHLSSLLKSPLIINETSTDIVSLGSSVLILENGTSKKYQIVGRHEANPREGKISDESPVGKLLMGKKAGDRFDLEINKSRHQYEIKEII